MQKLPISPRPAARAAGLVECCCSSDVCGGNKFGIGLHAVFAEIQTTQLFILSNPQATTAGTDHAPDRPGCR